MVNLRRFEEIHIYWPLKIPYWPSAFISNLEPHWLTVGGLMQGCYLQCHLTEALLHTTTVYTDFAGLETNGSQLATDQ